jgi:hypothetical protein
MNAPSDGPLLLGGSQHVCQIPCQLHLKRLAGPARCEGSGGTWPPGTLSDGSPTALYLTCQCKRSIPLPCLIRDPPEPTSCKEHSTS